MPLITKKAEVLAVYAEAAANKWVIPCFCTENLTTTEAILSAVLAHGQKLNRPDLPISIAITNLYKGRQQTVNYTGTRKWNLGLKLFLQDLKVLMGEDSPFAGLRVLIHLDHIQHDVDQELLEWDMSQFSSIMYDASTVSFEDNIRLTREFVDRHGQEIVIEGACDEIKEATRAHADGDDDLTTAERAEDYLKRTGVDMFVANLGTEHRAAASTLHYRGDLAREIRQVTGHKTVLHGASSVSTEEIANLFDDGICKVNIWTTLERDTAPALLEDMLRNIAKIMPSGRIEELKQEGLLGSNISSQGGKTDIGFFTNSYRQQVFKLEMEKIITEYLQTWYR
ncbi:MAG: fructose-bisphosphate aldolase, class [Clostridiales bacterium]|jgi:fructose/tagatose bisphosphate aldolase|nr:fructose-bisphosphate aldolase, class [Clostridiales bacterium]